LNPHPSIFPLLIKKYNSGGNISKARYFYSYLADWGISHGEAKEIKRIIHEWIGNQEKYTGEYFNEY
jgi:hypothetical protein